MFLNYDAPPILPALVLRFHRRCFQWEPASDRDRIGALSKLQAWPPCYGQLERAQLEAATESYSFLSLA
jgi:hypothetical protein